MFVFCFTLFGAVKKAQSIDHKIERRYVKKPQVLKEKTFKNCKKKLYKPYILSRYYIKKTI